MFTSSGELLENSAKRPSPRDEPVGVFFEGTFPIIPTKNDAFLSVWHSFCVPGERG